MYGHDGMGLMDGIDKDIMLLNYEVLQVRDWGPAEYCDINEGLTLKQRKMDDDHYYKNQALKLILQGKGKGNEKQFEKDFVQVMTKYRKGMRAKAELIYDEPQSRKEPPVLMIDLKRRQVLSPHGKPVPFGKKFVIRGNIANDKMVDPSLPRPAFFIPEKVCEVVLSVDVQDVCDNGDTLLWNASQLNDVPIIKGMNPTPVHPLQSTPRVTEQYCNMLSSTYSRDDESAGPSVCTRKGCKWAPKIEGGDCKSYLMEGWSKEEGPDAGSFPDNANTWCEAQTSQFGSTGGEKKMDCGWQLFCTWKPRKDPPKGGECLLEPVSGITFMQRNPVAEPPEKISSSDLEIDKGQQPRVEGPLEDWNYTFSEPNQKPEHKKLHHSHAMAEG